MELINIKPNFNKLNLGNIEIYFSYQTPIAFYKEHKLFIRENDWKQTTGKHLNYIHTDKKLRISGSEFEKHLGNLHLKS